MPSSSKSERFSSRGLISTKVVIRDSSGSGWNPEEHILRRGGDRTEERRAEMAYSVPPLPYDFGALEPHIDAQTMEIHHDKHHGTYVTNLNAALEGTEWMDRPIESVLASLDVIPEDKRTAVRNNGGGHSNHSFFWEIMGPNGGGEPSGALADAISSTFGSVDELKSQV